MTDVSALAAHATNVAAAARAHDAPDLAHTAAAVAGARDIPSRVVVVGDFKRGKTSLVNGLLATPVLPIDDTAPTALPVVVSGGPPGVRRVRAGEDGPIVEELDPSELADALGPDAATLDDVARVEVTLEARVLQRGYSIVDCPPAPPAHVAARTVTLDLASTAAVAVFVTDATQPLTAGELDLLTAVADLVPTTFVVVTKTDLAPHAAVVLDADRRAIADAGPQVDVLSVSNELRHLAVAHADSTLNEESGFPELVRAIDEGVARASAVREQQDAATLAAAAGSLEELLASRIDSLRSAEGLRDERERAEADVRAAERLRSGGANWQRVVSEAFVDIQTESSHVLNEGIKALLVEAERELGDLDPAKQWDVFEPWVRNKVAERIDAAFDDADHRAATAVEVAIAEFAGADLDLGGIADSSSAAAAIELAGIEMDADVGGRESRIGGGITGMRGLYTGPMMLGLLGQAGLSGALLAALAPVGMVLGVGLGAKAIRDDRTRQIEARRRKALASTRTFIDLAAGRARKELQSYLRVQQRTIRTSLGTHADDLAAQTRSRLTALDEQLPSPAERDRRLAALTRDRQRLADLRTQIESLAAGADS